MKKSVSFLPSKANRNRTCDKISAKNQMRKRNFSLKKCEANRLQKIAKNMRKSYKKCENSIKNGIILRKTSE